MILLLFAIHVCFVSLVYCDEVITLENKTHILCTTDNLQSALYVSPPIPEEIETTSFIVEDDKFWKDNWLLKNSTDVTIDGVADKRWEEFGTVYTDKLHFESVTSFSFSLYGTASMNVTFSDVNKTVTKRTRRDASVFWQHNTAWNKESRPFQISVVTAEKNYWKIHSYKLRWAETISEEPMNIQLPSNDASCLILYMYICFYCTLDVRTFNLNYILQGTLQEASELSEWKIVKIENSTEIRLVRNTTNGQHEGFWGIDIRQCPITKSNRAIRDFKLEDDDNWVDRECKTLSFPLSYNQTNVFGCDAGKLGQKCDLQCEDLLGPENKFCEKHKMCDTSSTDSKCYCAWGYQGQSCEQSCPAQTWGLSCQNRCNNCKSCNPQTGKCTSGTSLTQFSTGTGVVVSLVVGIRCIFPSWF